MITEGSKAPDFKLLGEDGKPHSLKGMKSKYVVLYFYPKDLTPGCTIQAMTYSKKLGALKKLGASVVGVSKDDVALHKRFKSKCNINFQLLSDPSSKTIKRYGAYGDRGDIRDGYIEKHLYNKQGQDPQDIKEG